MRIRTVVLPKMEQKYEKKIEEKTTKIEMKKSVISDNIC